MKNEKLTTPATEPVLPIQTKHLAVKFGMKATALRRVLRAMPRYADGVHTNYRWADKDPLIDEIAITIKRLEAEKKARKDAAASALKARAEKLATQKKTDAAAGIPAAV